MIFEEKKERQENYSANAKYLIKNEVGLGSENEQEDDDDNKWTGVLFSCIILKSWLVPYCLIQCIYRTLLSNNKWGGRQSLFFILSMFVRFIAASLQLSIDLSTFLFVCFHLCASLGIHSGCVTNWNSCTSLRLVRDEHHQTSHCSQVKCENKRTVKKEK